MSKVLKTAAIVVGSIALVATGVGAAAGAGLFGSSLGTAGLAAAAAGVAKVATFAAVGLSFAGGLTAAKPQFDQASIGAEWRADPYAGLPYAMGETAVGGMIVMRRTDDAWAGGDENDLQTVISVLSCAGPVEAFLGTDVDRVATSFNPSTGAATGTLADYFWWKGQLGQTPESAQLNIAAGSSGAPSGWTASHKLSGLAADMVRMRYDSKGEKFAQGEPEKRVRGRWVKVYDPRLDGTYPGGSGSCRPFVESTYVWSRNPHLHALTWAMGRYANGKLIAGLGLSLGDILVDEYIEGANICDANGWRCDGVVFTRPQSAWNNLKLMLATGGAEPYTNGGRVGCRNQIPRVAVGSITSADLRGEASGPVTRPRRERKNIGFYRYRSPAHEYDLIDAGAPVRITSYITADGNEERPITEEWPLVQDEDQAAALTAYRIAETREAEPISFVLGPRFHAFKPGDCITDDTPEGGGRLLRIEKRSVDLEAATISLICRTETTAKHAVALGVVGQVPPVIAPPAVPGAPAAPGVSAWAVAGTAISDTGGAIPALVITGAVDNPAATEILFWYRPNGASVWRAAGTATPNATRHEITAVTPGTSYEAAVSYRVRGILGERRVLGPVTAGVPVLDFGNVAGSTRPENNSTRNVSRGTYDNATAYTRGDEVVFSGSSYRLIVNSSTGNAPPDVSRWALFAAAGSGPPGADGIEGITVIVTNEAHTVPTNADGSGGSYTSAGGTMILRRGATLLTPTFSIAAQSPATGWASIDASTGVYTVTDPGVTLATATLRATVGGVNYDRTYTLAKSLQGVAGPNLTLVADGQAFTFTDGAASPGSQTITLNALLTNLAGTATWTATPAVTLGGTGNTRTLALADFGTNRQVVIEATLGGITDRITLVRLERNVVAAANANRVPFSRFERRQGWAVAPSSTVAAFDPLRQAIFEGRYFIETDATASLSDQDLFLTNSPDFQVMAGERLSVAARVDGFALSGPQPSFWQFRIDFYNSGGFVDDEPIASGSGGISRDTLQNGFVTVPPLATLARLVMQAKSAGAGVMRVAFLEPMVTSAAAGQTVHPAYAPGPNAADGADVTRDTLPALNQGAWSAASVPYALGDIVTRNGSSHTCIIAHTSTGGNGPPGSNWALLADAGAQGPTGVSAPPIKSLSTGAAQLDPIRLVNGQAVTVAAELYLNTGGVAGVCSLELQISEAGAGSWATMTGGTASDSQPTSEPVELVIAGATFTNSGADRLFDIRAVSVRQSRSVNVPPSFMRVI
jgi:hypothetical protein